MNCHLQPESLLTLSLRLWRRKENPQLWLLVMQSVPVVVGYKFLLFSLNEHLSRTAVVVQPLVIPAGASLGDLQHAPILSGSRPHSRH